MRALNLLTKTDVAKAQPGPKQYNLADGGGLVLLVHPSGGKWWRFWYRRPGTGKRNTLSLGVYPDVSLADAREARDAARKQVAKGIDPGEQRKADAQARADTFEAVAREWYANNSPQWVPSHGERIIRRLERDVFPWLGRKPVASIKAADVLAAIRRIESRGSIETAHRALSNIGQVLRYAIACGLLDVDVTNRMAEALQPVPDNNFAAAIEPDEVAKLLRDMWACPGTLPVTTALRLSPYLFVRPSELRLAQWEEFDLDGAVWNIPPTRRKLKKANKENPLTSAHVVPLAAQAVTLLRDLYPLTGARPFVFPGMRDPKKPLSNAALLAAMRRQGYASGTVTMHGWRATARTILAERLHFPAHIIEHQLDHRVKDANGTAYNRTSFLPERKVMMQAWADYLDTLRDGDDKVVPIGRHA